MNCLLFQENKKMAKNYFEDRTTYEKRHFDICHTNTIHRVLSRWGVPVKVGRLQKIQSEKWEYE